MSVANGLHDEDMPLVSWQTRAGLTMTGIGAVTLLLWHVALVLTSNGLGLGNVGATLRALAHGHPLAAAGPHHGPSAAVALTVWGVLVVVLIALWLGAVYWWAGRRARRQQPKGMASRPDLDRMGAARVQSMAAQTRPSLSAQQVRKGDLSQLGLVVGHTLDTGHQVVASPEDHVLVKAPTGGGKTTQVMIPAALSAPGALIVTSTALDVLDVIYESRRKLGRVWVFDPLDLAGWFEPMVWNPITGCERGRVASARGLAFGDGIGGGKSTLTSNGEFFADMAAGVFSRLLHAAALHGDDMRQVMLWGLRLNLDNAQEAADIIRHSTDPRAQKLWADMLRSAATGADETVASTRMSFARMIEPLADEEVLACVTPRSGVRTFSPAEFVRSTDTLVLLSNNQSPVKAGALTALLFNEVLDEAERYANTLPTKRLDPFLRVVGDELPNIAPLRTMPSRASTLRKYGIHLVLGVQDDVQVERCWGELGADELMGNMGLELALPGIRSQATRERLSDLAGTVEVSRLRQNFDGGMLSGTSLDTHERRVLRPDEIRTLPDGTALAIMRNSPATLLRLTPWWEGPDADEVQRQEQATIRHRQTYAEQQTANAEGVAQ